MLLQQLKTARLLDLARLGRRVPDIVETPKIARPHLFSLSLAEGAENLSTMELAGVPSGSHGDDSVTQICLCEFDDIFSQIISYCRPKALFLYVSTPAGPNQSINQSLFVCLFVCFQTTN